MQVNRAIEINNTTLTYLAHAVNRVDVAPGSVEEKQQLQSMRLLIAAKADCNVPGFLGQRPIHFVRSIATARLLLENKAEINVKNSRGWAALVCASHRSRDGVVRFLIESKADLFAVDNRGCCTWELGAERCKTVIRSAARAALLQQLALVLDRDCAGVVASFVVGESIAKPSEKSEQSTEASADEPAADADASIWSDLLP